MAGGDLGAFRKKFLKKEELPQKVPYRNIDQIIFSIKGMLLVLNTLISPLMHLS